MLITRGTGHSSVLIVATVVSPPSSKAAILQARLISSAPDIVHPNLSRPTAKVGATVCMYCSTSESELSANDCSITDVPVVITDSAPLATMKHLDTALRDTTTSSNQPQSKICREVERRGGEGGGIGKDHRHTWYYQRP